MTISNPAPMWCVFGGSVRGPAHIANRSPNQDAWLGQVRPGYALAVVSDGLGSRPQAQVGAQAACWATRKAVALWLTFSSPTVLHLIRLVRALWEMRLAPHPVDECAATCLLALWRADGRLVLVGLGDGLLLARSAEGDLQYLTRPAGDFVNRTLSLGQPHTLNDWRVQELTQPLAGASVVLASDGVADDLQPERLGDWAVWLTAEFGALPAHQRGPAVRRALRQWPTPGHQDDKTLVVLMGSANREPAHE